jgi:hypothetical protein
VSFFDTGKEEKVLIDSNNKIYDYVSRLVKVIDIYEKPNVNVIAG